MQGISVYYFYILQLYYIHCLGLVIFWWHLYGFLCRGSYHLQTIRDSSFPIWIPFISLFSLIAVAKASRNMLNSSGESGYPCLVPDCRGNAFSFLPLRMFAVDLSFVAFIMLSYVPFLPAFWYVINGC